MCRALRLLGLEVPIVACTGNATASDALRYQAAGFTTMLSKPFRTADLSELLARVLPEWEQGGHDARGSVVTRSSGFKSEDL